jgi:hypothetical protein
MVEGGVLNAITNITPNFDVVTIGEKLGTLEAYAPYVVMPASSNLVFLGSATIKKTTNNDQRVVDSDWYFRAAYEKIVFGDTPLYGSAYGFSAENTDNVVVGQFVKAGKKAWIRPLRGFLVYEGNSGTTKSAVGSSLGRELPAEINVVVQDEQGNVVERGVLDTKTGEFRMDRWYDLQGRKLNGEPQVQGTYYHNGKKVIIK